MPRQAALAFKTLEQRGLLAADIGAGAATHVNSRTACGQLGDLERKQLERGRIFVAQIDVDVLRVDDMRRNQRPFEETVSVAEQIEAILERTGLALVTIDGHQPGTRLAQHCPPFAAGGKAGAAEPPQAGVVQNLENVFLADPPRAQVTKQLVAALADIGLVIDIGRDDWMGLAPRRGIEDLGRSRIEYIAVSDFGDRRAIAEPDAGRAHHANAGAGLVLQFVQQLFRAHHGAGQRIADANGQRRDIRLAFLHHVEMRVEGRGLEHFRKRQLHLVGKRRQMRRRDLAIFVLDQVQVLDQEIAAPRPVAEQKLDLVGGGRVDLAALRGRLGPLPSRARMFERADRLYVMDSH